MPHPELVALSEKAWPTFDVVKADVPEHCVAAVDRVIEVAFPRVVEHLALAPEPWEAEGRRGVWLWGVIGISAAADGTDLRLHPVIEDPDAEKCAASADLKQPISRFGCSAAMSPLITAAARECGVDPKLPRPGGIYLRRAFARNFGRSVDWNRLRRSVLGQLRLDPLVVSLTRRTFEGGYAPLESHNWVARHVRELALVAAEHPRLLPFLQLVSRVEGSPVETFERTVREAGITPSARRKLERWGFEPFSAATEFCMDDRAIETVARFANLLDRLGIQEPPDAMFVELALRGGIDSAPDWFLRTLHQEVAMRAEETDDPYPEDYELVAAWINASPPTPDAHQQRSWPWIAQQAWTHRALTDAAAREPWPVPSGTLAVAGHEAVPLRSALDLRTEGDAMRNCLAKYEDDCRAGKVAVYSIRKGRRRLADLALERTGDSWRVAQVAGKGNREVPEMAGLAEEVARATSHPIPPCTLHPTRTPTSGFQQQRCAGPP